MRHRVMTGVSVAAALVWAVMPAPTHTQVRPGANAERAPQSVAEFEKLQQQVSNWGRWGKDDQLGTWNLVTKEKVKQAAKLVKEGIVISLAHTLITEKAADTPNEPGQGLGPFLMESGGSKYTISFHSTTHSHVDALCQFDYKGKIYNGFDFKDRAKDGGCAKADINLNKAGFTTRGVLMDIPRLRGVSYLEPGTPVYPEDFEAWEKQAGFKVQPGDAIFLRTGRWERRAKVAPWNLIPPDPQAGEAGYHISTVPWMRQRDVAMVAADVSNDVRPPGTPKAVLDNVRGMPVHSLVIVSMGGYIVDALDLEELSATAARLKRWTFMVTGAPDAVKGGTGSLLNLTAVF